MKLHTTRIALPALLALLVGCSSSATDSANDRSAPTPDLSGTSGGTLARSFAASATKANVPRDLLVAIAQVEDGLSLPQERSVLDVDVDNEVPAAGPLQLRRGKLNTLQRGAELVNASELDLRLHADLALDAGALVLRELGAQTNASPDTLASWKNAVGEMSGYADDANREHYVHQVYALLARGGAFAGRDGETITLLAHPDLPPSLTIDVSSDTLHALAAAQFPGAQWVPTSCSNKCTPGRAGNPVDFVVIHDTEGGWNASVATLQNDPGKSVHYIVGDDGKVAQFVTEDTTAWHAGNFNYNQRSVGIEHVGYATKPFTEVQYAASAKLVDYLLTKYSVPRNRAHVIGHDQIPNGNIIAESATACATSPKACEANTSFGGADHHTDPGVWEWATFMPRVNGNAKCDDMTNLFNCSNDKTEKFRCVAGKVEVDHCADTCVSQANGVDDTCTLKTDSTPAGTPVSPPAVPTTNAPGSEPPSGSVATPQNGALAPSTDPSPSDASGGCTIARSTSPSSSASSSALLILATTLLLKRLKRQKNRGPRANA